MRTSLDRVGIRVEQDVVRARQHARVIAEAAGLDRTDQTRLATATSEVARNAFQYAGGGEVLFEVEGGNPKCTLVVTVRDEGPGIADLKAVLSGRYASRRGMGIGLLGSTRIADGFDIDTGPGRGTTVTLRKVVPEAPGAAPGVAHRVAEALVLARAESPMDELQVQNRELAHALELVRIREEELSRVNKELRNRNADLKDFTYTVSHDLKAPLRGIAGYAAELDRKHRDGLGERPRFCIAQILTASRNLDRLIEDLLHFSRLDSEHLTLTEVDLGELVASALRDRSHAVAESGAEVTVDVRLRSVRTSERAISQVLANVLDNALKYSRGSAPPRIRVVIAPRPGGWSLSVSDNGIGFDMKYHDRIFGLFNRLVRAEEFEGSGAGLAIAKKQVERLHGRIWAESAPGQGATFHVELPGPSSDTSSQNEPQGGGA